MADSQSPVEPPQPERAVPPKPPRGRGSPNSGLTVGGWILAGLEALLVIAGVALVIVHLTQRDQDGYYTSSTVQVAAPGYAVTAESLHIANLPTLPHDVMVRVRVVPTRHNGRAQFAGS